MPLADINPNDKWVTDDQGRIIGIDSGDSSGPQYFGVVEEGTTAVSSRTNLLTAGSVFSDNFLMAGYTPTTRDLAGVIEALMLAVASPNHKTVLFEDALYDLGAGTIPIISGISYIGVPARFKLLNGGWIDKSAEIIGGTRFTSTANYVFWDGAINQGAITATVAAQNVTFTAGSPNLSVTNGAAFTSGQRVYFTASGNGFYSGTAYIVLSIVSNTLQLCFADQVAIVATSSGTLASGISAGRVNDISNGVVMKNLSGVEVNTFIKAGATNTFSFGYSKFEEIYAIGKAANRGTFNVKRLIDITNFSLCEFSGIYSWDGDGQFWGTAYPLANFVPGNSIFTNLFNANNGVSSTPLKQKGIIFQGAVGSTTNQIIVNMVQNNAAVITAQSVTTGAQSIGTAISVPDSTLFPVDLPISVTAAVNGLSIVATYYVTSSAANFITISTWKGGTAFSLTGTSAITFTSYGFPGLEFVGLGDLASANYTNVEVTGVDLEGAGNCKITVQNATATLRLNSVAHTDSNFTIVGRSWNGFLFNKARLSTDFEGNCGVTSFGPQITSATSPYVGGAGLFFDYTNSVYGLSVHRSGRSSTPALAGISTGSGNWTKANYPIGLVQSTRDTTKTFGSSFDAGKVIFNGAAGQTFTLPTITNASLATSMVGMTWEFVNASANTLAVATNGTQTFNNQAAKTTTTIAIGASIKCTGGITAGGTLFWIAEYTPAIP